MAQQIINIGANPSDGSGDPLRVSFDKINDNFTELYSGNIAPPTGGNVTPPSGSGTVTSVSGKVGAVRLVVGDVDGAVSQNYVDNKVGELVFDTVNDQIIDLTAASPSIVNDMQVLAASIQADHGYYIGLVEQLATKLSMTNGGTMLAPLQLNADPVVPAEAATKRYVDTKIQEITTAITALASSVYTKAEMDQLLLNITNSTNDYGSIAPITVDNYGSITDAVTDIEDYGGII